MSTAERFDLSGRRARLVRRDGTVNFNADTVVLESWYYLIGCRNLYALFAAQPGGRAVWAVHDPHGSYRRVAEDL